MNRFKPLNLLDNKGFWSDKTAVVDAIREILSIGGCREEFPVRDYGRYRSPQWRDDHNNLVPWQSVDWYVYDALNQERMQVDSSQILHSLATEPWRDERLLGDHYDLFVMEEDMYDPAAEGNGSPGYCVGACKPFSAAVISTHRIDHIWGLPYGCIKTEVMRQVCFMLGVPSSWRREVERGTDGQVFCSNRCILRRSQNAPQEWEELTADRMQHGALCELCERDLQEFFEQAHEEAGEVEWGEGLA
jgi:hypothetical protein